MTGGPPHLRWLDRVDPSPERILARARDLVAYGWCQGAEARDADDDPVKPWSPEARCWSLLGALVAAVDLPAQPGAVTLQPLRRALAALAEVIEDPLLAAWNDQEGRTQDLVVRALETARVVFVDWGDTKTESDSA
jgi:hypothetical protein